MRILLDTHTLIWYEKGSSRISAKAKQLIENAENETNVSIVSLWEMAIKRSRKKLKTGKTPLEYLAKYRSAGARFLQILPVHTMVVETLPFHHADPFDRMLIAQAQTENLTILTVDKIFTHYDVKTAW